MIFAPLLMLFAEDALCARLARDITDQVILSIDEPEWLRERVAESLDSVRAWGAISEGNGEYTSRSDLKRSGIRVNEIDVEDSRGWVTLTLKAFKFATERRVTLNGRPCALTIAFDAEGDSSLRQSIRAHCERLAERAQKSERPPLALVLAMPDPESECWVIAGFSPENRAEREALDEVTQTLGFDPTEKSSNLSATSGDVRDSKSVAQRLFGAVSLHNNPRAVACWDSSEALARLLKRGHRNGLQAFIADVNQRLLPVVSGRR